MDKNYEEALARLTKETIEQVKDTVSRIGNYTSFHQIRGFTPAQVEILINHIEKCHKVLWELSEVNDYEMPYRVPKLIYAARALRDAVS